MQSSCNVIKGSIISGFETITPPAVCIDNTSYITDDKNDLCNKTNEERESVLRQAELTKRDIIKKAENEADKIINSAKSKAEEIMKGARDEGYQTGYKEGYKHGYSYGKEESLKEGQKIKDEASQYLKNCQEAIKAYIYDKEKSIIDLSIEIARHIIHTELKMNPDAIYEIAHQAVSKVADKHQLILRVSPHDFPILKDKKDGLSIFTENPSDLIIIPDDTIKPGCVTAETSSGLADTDIDKQLAAIRKLLAGD